MFQVSRRGFFFTFFSHVFLFLFSFYFRYSLKPSSYWEAANDCSSRGEKLISPTNMVQAVEMFSGTMLGKARLNALANETCFKDGEGEKLDLKAIFGEEFVLQVPEAKSSEYVMAFELTGEFHDPVILEADRRLTTICSYGNYASVCNAHISPRIY